MKRLGWAVAAIPLAYLAAALLGSLVPVNRGWTEPEEGITVYLADNGIHADLVLPVNVEGLDWEEFVPPAAFQEKPGDARWIAFGAGERKVYLETPTWSDISAGTISSALIGGERVMHVEWVRDPTYSARQIRLTREQYRRLWTAIRAGFRLDASGRAITIDHPGYWRRDAFFEGVGKASAVDTCNQWIASRLRLAGIKAPSWSPFVQGLSWHYRKAEPPIDQST